MLGWQLPWRKHKYRHKQRSKYFNPCGCASVSSSFECIFGIKVSVCASACVTICFHFTQNSWVASSVKTRGIFHSAKVFLFNRFKCKWSVDLPESLRNKTSSLDGHPLCLFRPVGIQNYHSFCGKLHFHFFGFMLYHVGVCSTNGIVSL